MIPARIRHSFFLRPGVLVLVAVVLFAVTGDHLHEVLLGHLKAVSVAAIVLIIAYAIGMKLLRLLGIYQSDLYPIGMKRHGEHLLPADAESEQQWRTISESQIREIISWEKTCFAVGLGLGVLSYTTLALALLGLLRPLPVLIALAVAAFAVPGEIKWLYRYSQLPIAWRKRGENPRKGFRRSVRATLLILIAIPVSMSFLSSLAPPHQSDALRYHLAVPAAWVHEGGWTDLRDNAFSHFPFTIDMLYALLLVLGQDVACRILHWAFFVLTLCGVYAFSKRFQNSSAGLLSAAVLATTPFVPIMASWAFIEMGMTYYFLLSFYALAMWMNSLFQRRIKKGWLGPYQLPLRSRRVAILTGIVCGLAMGCKYTALFLAVFLFLVMLGVLFYLDRRRKQSATPLPPDRQTELPPPLLQKSDYRDLVWFALTAILVFSPWMIKNLIVTGNPLFPFLNGIFDSPYWSRFEAAFYSFHAGQKGGLNEVAQMGLLGRLVDLITLPWRATTQHLGNWAISPAYFLYTLILIIFTRRWSRLMWYLMGGAGFFFLVWSATYRDNRFLLPVLVLLALAFGHALAGVWRQPGRRASTLIFGLVFLLGLNCVTLFFNWTADQNPFAVVAGRQSREDFLTSRLDYYPAMKYLNELPTSLHDARVLMVGEYRPYYCQRSYLANDWFNQPVLIRFLRETGGVEPLVQYLKSEGIRYIFLNDWELSKGGYNFFYHFHFLKQDEALSALDALKAGQLSSEKFWKRVMEEPIYRQYREFLYSGHYLRRIYPEGPHQTNKIEIYELIE